MKQAWTTEKTLRALTYKHALARRVCNSVFRMPWLFNLWTRRKWNLLDADYWQSRKEDGKRGIANYLKLSPTSGPLLDEVERRALDKAAPVLDLGCNAGRHLNALLERGFTNLHGADVNDSCAEQNALHFPEVAAKATLTWESFEKYLPTVADNYFHLVFTHGKTIEHVHPRFPLARHICRICSHCVVLGNVGFTTGSFPRFWLHEFERQGFALVKLLQPEQEWSPESPQNRPHSLVVFQRIVQE